MFTISPNWTKLNNTDNLQPGDIIYMRYKIKSSWTWLKSAGVAKAESKINSNNNFQLLSSNYIDDPGYVWFKIKVVENDDPEVFKAGITLGQLIAIATVVAFYFIITHVDSWLASRENVAMYGAISSGNVTPEDVIQIENAKTQNKLATDDSIGGQVQKAGTGLLLTAGAIAGIFYLYKKRG